jgi:hypothetical protein
MRIVERKTKCEEETKKTAISKSKLAYVPSDVKIDRDGKYIECSTMPSELR